jgi:hypothetical protein
MPSPCAASSGGSYKIGHNTILFYTDLTVAQCQAGDPPVDSLTVASGPFWDDLQNQTRPASAGSPASATTARAPRPCRRAAGGRHLAGELPGAGHGVTQLPGRQRPCSRDCDEGNGPDYAAGEDRTNIMSVDLPVASGVSAHQDSCHIPLLVVYPFIPARGPAMARSSICTRLPGRSRTCSACST